MTARSMSFSQAQSLARCERRWVYRYGEGLRSDRPNNLGAIRGQAWHAVQAAALIERGLDKGSLLWLPITIEVMDGVEIDLLCSRGEILAKVMQAVVDWEQDQDTEYRDAMVSEYGAPLSERLREVYRRYQDRWAEEDAYRSPLLVEWTWTREAPNGRWLTGRLDSVVYDEDQDLIVVVDSKSHKSWPAEHDAVLDLMGSQNHLNAWGVAPDLRRLSGSAALVPQAVEFDRVRFKMPTTPVLTQAGALSKSVTDFDALTYREWAEQGQRPEPTAAALKKGLTQADMPLYSFDQELYDRLLEADREGAWFRRSLKPLSMNAVEAHVKSLQSAAARSEGIDYDTAVLSPSNDCQWCEFSQLCRAEIVGGKIPYEELNLHEFGLRKKG